MLILILLLLSSAINSQELNKKKSFVSKNDNKGIITFGSCNKMFDHQDSQILSSISEQKSDLFVWLGDAAYIDQLSFPLIWKSTKSRKEIQKKFNKTSNDIHYKNLKNVTKIIGIYDDHDFNCNNGDKDFKGKREIAELYLDFIEEEIESERRNIESRQGIYSSYYLQNKFNESEKVLIILLDTRYNKDQGKGDMLGKVQWSWLEKELKENEGQFVVICSGTQFLQDERIVFEQWFNESRMKLIEMLGKHKVKAMIISGDVHFAEISTHPCTDYYLGYPLLEVTSSGLTHLINTEFPIFELISPFLPTTYNEAENRVVQLNYGQLDINWINNTIILNISIKGIHNRPFLSHSINISAITFPLNNHQSFSIPSNCSLHLSLFQRYSLRFQYLISQKQYKLFLNLFLSIFLILFIIIYLLVFIFKFFIQLIKYYSKLLGFNNPNQNKQLNNKSNQLKKLQ